MVEDTVSKEKKRAKRYVVVSTSVYFFLIPLLFLWAAIMLSTGSDSHMEFIIRILRFSIPITMLVCICMAWSRYYVYEQYKAAAFLALFPLLPLGIFIIAEIFSD